MSLAVRNPSRNRKTSQGCCLKRPLLPRRIRTDRHLPFRHNGKRLPYTLYYRSCVFTLTATERRSACDDAVAAGFAQRWRAGNFREGDGRSQDQVTIDSRARYGACAGCSSRSRQHAGRTRGESCTTFTCVRRLKPHKRRSTILASSTASKHRSQYPRQAGYSGPT